MSSNNTHAWLLGIALLLAAPAAMAVDEYGRWYGSLMVSGIDEDRDRGLETEWAGYHLGVARGFGPDWAVELNLVGTRFKNQGGDLAARQWGFGADVTRRIADTKVVSPYVLAGVGWMMTDYKLQRFDKDGATASVGIGMMVPVSTLDMALRTELRARRDTSDGSLTDFLFSIGIKVPFSLVNLGPAPAERRGDGTLPPEAEAQPWGLKKDTDGDGVADVEDQCPGTPAGEVINSLGCAPQEDTDDDGIPDGGDICPDTPAGAPVDDYGCMIAVPAEGGD